ncbi:MAG TPA: magnesium/cobalt transporter CorA [Spirochaetota bacterium]|nr:MAG: Magnesium transport protein CorA [Spirochaetes bacterium ADurb.BinA120]HPI15584.1 magnesium/cobalt transporter CorA [Spirochaetota bacterium]
MRKLTGRVSKKRGLPPGALVHVGDKKAENAKILVIDYNENNYNICDSEGLAECRSPMEKPSVRWVDIVGIDRVEVVAEAGSVYNLHPLVMEDILNTSQRPKLDDWDGYTFIVLKALHFDEPGGEITAEQVSLVLREDTVISFQEIQGDDFLPIIDRIINNHGRIRKLGADYLLYTIIDSIVDNYFVILERLGDRIESLEDEFLSDPQKDTIHRIHSLKREMIFLRKSVWPLREVISRLERGEGGPFENTTMVYLRDIHDHIVQIIDTVELFRDMLSGILDIYLTSVNNRLNEVMKLLTVITTIFIPISFIAGVYGMNFRFMPETEWRWAYFAVIGLMAAIGLSMFAYFKRKRWI